MKSGIYMIENIINGKKYIGSSKNVLQRIRQHKNQLKANIHSNKHLQSSYNKYGIQSFLFTKIEACEDIINREKYYINLLNTLNPQFGYNKASTIENTSGYKWSKESRKRFSEFKKSQPYNSKCIESMRIANINRKYKTGKDNPNYGKSHYWRNGCKPVLRYDIYGIFVKEYESVADVQKDGFCKKAVANCANGVRNHSGWNFWIYKKSDTFLSKIELTVKQIEIQKQFERSHSNMSDEFGELLENPEGDNQQPSVENDITVSTKVQRLMDEESANNSNTSAEQCITI